MLYYWESSIIDNLLSINNHTPIRELIKQPIIQSVSTVTWDGHRMICFRQATCQPIKYSLATVACASFLLIASGCSSKQMYNAIQENRQQACLKSPPGQYDQCMAEHSQSFREYQQQREQVLQQPEPPLTSRKPLKANKKDSENKSASDNNY